MKQLQKLGAQLKKARKGIQEKTGITNSTFVEESQIKSMQNANAVENGTTSYTVTNLIKYADWCGYNVELAKQLKKED